MSAVLVLPGLALALSLRLRGWTALGAAPALTFLLVLLGVLVSSLTGWRWTPGLASGVVLVAVAAAAGAGVLPRRRTAVSPAPGGRAQDPLRWSGLAWSVATAVGVALGSLLSFRTMAVGTSDLTDPNQGFDALFHVNTIETITRTGDVAPTVTGLVNGYPEGVSSYPDAFHAMASLLVQLGGTTLGSVNGMLAAIPLVAGLGLVALLRRAGHHREAVFVPLLLAATSGYPTQLVWRGPIWVFAFGIAILPAFLVVLLEAVDRRSVLWSLVLGLSAAGLALIHPSAALSAAVFAASALLSRWWRDRAAALRDLLFLVPAVVVAAAVVFPLIGQALVDSGGGSVVDWPAVQTPGEALGELLTYNYAISYPQTWLALPALVGLVVGWRRPALRWWLAGTVTFAGACVLAAAYDGPIVQLLTGPWWNDRFRFEGLYYLGASVAAGVGLVAITDAALAAAARVAPRLRVLGPRAREIGTLLTAAVAVVLLGVLSNGFYTTANVAELRKAYGYQAGGSVGPGDLEAFPVLRELAGDGPVLNDPNDGSAWMWTLAGVRPVFGAALTVPVTPPLAPDRQLLVDGMNCLDTDGEVRRVVEDLGVSYVYVSEATILGGPTPTAGFRDLASVRSLTPVYSRDGVTIYRIVLQPAAGGPPADSCRLR